MLKIKSYISIISVILIALMFSCSKPSVEYTVTGKLENVKDSVFFAAIETNDTLYIDTVRINPKGEFRFSGMVDTLSVISLYFKESAVSPYVMVDKGWNVSIKGDINYPDLILAKGGNINNDLTQFKNDNMELLKSRSEIVRTQNALTEKSDTISKSERTVELKNLNFELLNIASDFVKKNPEKIASVILIDNFFKNEESLERLGTALDQLRGAAYDFPLAAQLREYKNVIGKSTVGASAPDFKLNDINDKSFELKSLKEKYVLLTFISTTCEACVEIYPLIVKEYESVKKEKMNIEFVTLVKDIEGKPITEEEKRAAKWTTLPEYGGWSSPIFESYNIKELPYSILISPEGKILERNVAVYNLKTKLEGYPNIKIKKENKYK